MINSEIFQSIRSQLTHHPPRISQMNTSAVSRSQSHHPRGHQHRYKHERHEEKQSFLHQSTKEQAHGRKPTERLFIAIEKELTYKQHRIESLELEAEEKTEQFNAIANEITRLREESASIKRLNQQLSLRLQEISNQDREDYHNIDLLEAGKLRQMVKKFAAAHKHEKNRRKQLETASRTMLNKLKAAKEVHSKYTKIQNAAQEQAEFIRKLQKRQREMDQYKDTILSQEQVIEKLEEMLSWAHGTIKTLQQKMDSGNVVSNRERELENEVISLQQENDELRKQIQSIRADKFHEIADNVDKLKDELRAANYRNDGLQEQLKTDAGQFGKQIGELKIQIRKIQSDENDTIDVDMMSGLSDITSADLSNISDMLNSIDTTMSDKNDD